MITNVKFMQYLESVYRHGNLTHASEELNVSQPAISAAIASMEKELGYQLVVRGAKGVTFTLEGEHLMSFITRLLKDLQEADIAARELSEAANNQLRLGISPTLGVHLLPKIYKDFLPQWPGAELFLYEGGMNRQIKGVKDNAIDLSFNALPDVYDEWIGMLRLTRSKICAVMRPDHPLAELERIPMSAFHGMNVVMLDEKYAVQKLMNDAFKKAGVFPRFVSSHEQILCLFQMVKYGNHVGFINTDPGCDSFSMLDKGLVMRPLEQEISFDVGFFYPIDRRIPKIAHELIDFTKANLLENM